MTPGNDEGRLPGRSAANSSNTLNQQRTAAMRRREAALRCEPLADGRRDPDDELVPKTAPRLVCWGCSALSWAERDRLTDCSSICLLAARSA